MKFIIGFIALIAFQWLGETLKTVLQLPLPGPVIGMIVLLMALMVYGQIPQGLERVSQPLLQHMSLLFIPPGVGLFFLAPDIFNQWLAILLGIFISTAVTLAITGILMQRLFARS
jgi:holin-like protein